MTESGGRSLTQSKTEMTQSKSMGQIELTARIELLTQIDKGAAVVYNCGEVNMVCAHDTPIEPGFRAFGRCIEKGKILCFLRKKIKGIMKKYG